MDLNPPSLPDQNSLQNYFFNPIKFLVNKMEISNSVFYNAFPYDFYFTTEPRTASRMRMLVLEVKKALSFTLQINLYELIIQTNYTAMIK